jgi:ribokinase
MILIFGSINIDLVARVESIPRPGETVLSSHYDTLFGGKGANQAVAAARVSEPGQVAMAAYIGDDAFGHAARDNLEHNGVAVDLVVSCSASTGCAFITVDQRGENAITVASGANAAISDLAVPASALDASTTAILQMEVPFTASLGVARRVCAAGGRVIWNFAPAPTTFSANDLSDLIKTTHILVVNEHEALTAAEILGCKTDDIREAGSYLSGLSNNICVITAGARGAFGFHPDGGRTSAQSESIQPLDTTGAGDTFVGILASGLDEGRSFEAALARAVRGASLSCLAHGAQSGMPSRQQLDGSVASM